MYLSLSHAESIVVCQALELVFDSSMLKRLLKGANKFNIVTRGDLVAGGIQYGTVVSYSEEVVDSDH